MTPSNSTKPAGTMKITGIQNKVSIRRDQYAIPYIQADNAPDAWFGLGFAQGMDRPFQLEFYKRQAKGALSQIFGADFLQADRYMRLIGLQRTADEYMKQLDPEILETLSSFSEGVNQGIQHRQSSQSDAFHLLQIEPTSFSPADIISIHLFLSLSLTHWLGKLTRYLLLQKESAETVNRLDPAFAEWNYVIKPSGQMAGKDNGSLLKELTEVKKQLNKKGASNNWTVAGSHTANGAPIVANDPHLSADIPAPWYFASVKCPQFQICGACYPASPLFFNGHNEHVAWSMTAAFIDNTDIYLEQLNPEGNAVLVDGQYVPCRQVEETIHIKGQAAHLEKVLVTKHGPIISPAMRSGEHAFSLCATWLTPKPIQGFFAIQNCRSVHDARELFRGWPLTSTNLVMADTEGNICWQLCGEIPDRKKTRGMLPMPGWDSSYDWHAKNIPYGRNPYLLNPCNGFIATANNKHSADDQDPYTGRDFIDGYRHARVVNLLQQKKKWTLAETQKMQHDVLSGPWRDMRESILRIKAESPQAEKALQILSQWNGEMSSDSIATTVHEFFMAEMTRNIIKEIAPDSVEMIYETYNPAVGSACFAMSRISQIIRHINEQPDWLFQGNWNKIINEALRTAIEKITAELGTDESKWQWGTYRPLVLRHPLTRNLKSFQSDEKKKMLNLGPVPWAGNEQTLCVAAGDMLDPKVTPDFIPNLQSVMEVGKWESNSFCLAGGQNEDPQSDHYNDLFSLWIKGEGICIAWGDDAVERVVIDETHLVPGQS